MKFGFRMPSLGKRISARLSPARYVRHSLGVKAPRGWGWFTNPKKALYNRVYNRTTFGIEDVTRVRKRSGGKLFVLMIILTLLGWAWRAFASEVWQTHSYTVVRITDGDTFVATDGNIRFRVRIAGMDAPEKSQSFGKVATNALTTLIASNTVKIQTVGNGLDQYGRVLGQVFVNDKDVALDMIKQGLATYYRPRCVDYPANKGSYNYDPRTYIEAEGQARARKTNFWSVAGNVLPCEFRKANKR